MLSTPRCWIVKLRCRDFTVLLGSQNKGRRLRTNPKRYRARAHNVATRLGEVHRSDSNCQGYCILWLSRSASMVIAFVLCNPYGVLRDEYVDVDTTRAPWLSCRPGAIAPDMALAMVCRLSLLRK